MSDVFISYSSKEVQTANIVRKILEDNNISCWMAPDSIPAGGNYMSVIPKAISECQIMVLVLSEESQKSIWVPKEVEQAINKRKLIIPFLIENCRIEDVFSFIIGNSQRIDAYIETTKALKKLVKNVKAILNEEIDENNIINNVGNFEIKPKTTGQAVNGNIITEDGDIYEGTLIDNIPNGKGKMEYVNGDVYEGFLKDGKRVGKGKMIYANGDIYEGTWKNNLPNGKGRSGNYEGDWVDGEKTGKGHLEKTSESYTGDFVKGVYEGKGVYIKKDYIYNEINKKYEYVKKYKYEGDFKNGKFEGYGEIEYNLKKTTKDFPGTYLISKYSGNWKDGKENGEGKLEFNNNSQHYFKGIFENGNVKGYGEEILIEDEDDDIEGIFYKKGEWKDGEINTGNVYWKLEIVDQSTIISCKIENKKITEYKIYGYYGKFSRVWDQSVNYSYDNKYEPEEIKIVWNNGVNYYKGFLKNGLPEKRGMFVIEEKGYVNSQIKTIDGFFENGLIQDKTKVTIKYPNGETYIGTAIYGYQKNEGRYDYPNKDYCEGKWIYDEFANGVCKKTFDDGFYEGEYLNGKIAGKGKYIWNNGDWYDGEWKDGKKHGKGKFKTAQTGIIEDVEYYEDRKIGENKNASEVFISYSSKEEEKVSIIRKALEDNKISCWTKSNSVPEGGNYMKEIPNAIANCKVMIVVISEESQKSVYVQKEVEQAFNNNKTIIPFFIENCEVTNEFSFLIGRFQRINAYDKMQDGIEELIARIRKI